jgi:hypothetical protein
VSWRLPPDMRIGDDEPAGPRVLKLLLVDVTRNPTRLLL